MNKSIKTRDIIKDVKSIDKALIAGERVRDISAKTKEHIEENTHYQYASPDDYAISKVNENAEHFINKAGIEAKIQTQKGYRFVHERRKRKKIKIMKYVRLLLLINSKQKNLLKKILKLWAVKQKKISKQLNQI